MGQQSRIQKHQRVWCPLLGFIKGCVQNIEEEKRRCEQDTHFYLLWGFTHDRQREVIHSRNKQCSNRYVSKLNNHTRASYSYPFLIATSSSFCSLPPSMKLTNVWRSSDVGTPRGKSARNHCHTFTCAALLMKLHTAPWKLESVRSKIRC